MRSHAQKAKHYRDRAAEIRAIAADMTDPHARASLLATAEQYEFVAEWFERTPDIASSVRAKAPGPEQPETISEARTPDG